MVSASSKLSTLEDQYQLINQISWLPQLTSKSFLHSSAATTVMIHLHNSPHHCHIQTPTAQFWTVLVLQHQQQLLNLAFPALYCPGVPSLHKPLSLTCSKFIMWLPRNMADDIEFIHRLTEHRTCFSTLPFISTNFLETGEHRKEEYMVQKTLKTSIIYFQTNAFYALKSFFLSKLSHALFSVTGSPLK